MFTDLSPLLVVCSYIPFYLLGAFPSGRLVAHLHGVDIHAQGSGNVGATNVGRVIGKKAGIITLILDVMKGCLGVLLATALTEATWYQAGSAFVIVAGHCISIPPYLRGGKGVATGLGVSIILAPWAALAALILFAAVFWIARIVSLASIVAALSVPVFAFYLAAPECVARALTGMALLIVFRHRANLARLSRGEEPRFEPRT